VETSLKTHFSHLG